MYENYTKQALPDRNYRQLLGTALCVFNANNSFIIENVLNNDDEKLYNWFNLIEQTSGNLSQPIKKTITKKSDTQITILFSDLVTKRNRIVHSFQITDKNNGDKQILSTKNSKDKQYRITEDFLLDFIEENDKLSDLLHEFRGY
jgi:hypothetical protein